MGGRHRRPLDRQATYGEVFGVREFRSIWLAQALSFIGDQFAQVALAVLVYDNTHSPLKTAVAYALTYLPPIMGGPILSVLADLLPRRRVMIFCDLARAGILALMAVEHLPFAALCALIFCSVLLGTPFTAARAALLSEVLPGDMYVVGSAINNITHQLTQMMGFLMGSAVIYAVGTHQALGVDAVTFALSAVIELIARTAIRPGNESYARLNGTRGATTLLKSNVVLEDDCVVLTFKAKGGKAVRKACDAAKLVRAIGILRGVPGKRMFQYRDNSGNVRGVSTTQVNAFLREIAGIKISLKDFRTLMASAVVLESLSRISPAASARGRRKQVLEAVRAAADELSNTPAICRKSYVHDTIVTAFEDGILERFAATMKGYRTQAKREQLLAQVVATAGM